MEQAIVDSVQLGGSVDKDLSIMGLFIACLLYTSDAADEE